MTTRFLTVQRLPNLYLFRLGYWRREPQVSVVVWRSWPRMLSVGLLGHVRSLRFDR